ncbi:MAG: ATP-dependent DNA helicase RecG [Sulfurospirillaceae bacterium]|nr:ATP-dependent DNA helicase RecG [Sulfurospirillaceae bacterium]
MQASDVDAIDKERLKKLGVSTALELALILPYEYENSILSASPNLGQINTVHVKVLSVKKSPKVFQISFFAEAWNRNIEGVIFGAKAYHQAMFKAGADLIIYGKVQLNGLQMQMMQPKVLQTYNTIIPKYKSPFQNKTMLTLTQKYLSHEQLRQEGLAENEIAVIRSIHFPTLEDIYMYERIGRNEKQVAMLKWLEIYTYLRKLSTKKITFPNSCQLSGDELPFIQSLPFALTDDQRAVIADIKRDFLGENAAKRVVMGDVGCGKTMVILSAVMMAYPHKAILMAPTTILATQIYEEAKKYLPSHVTISLVVQESSRKENYEMSDFIIGTHALLYRSIPHCALVMVDEQHRFGTKQRSQLSALVSKSAKPPHFIQFSATPIPRTLSLMQSSLVDFSFIKTLPFKKDITTRIIGKSNFKALIEHMKQEIALGHQCIVVYPLVEESEVIEYQSIDEGRGFWEKNFEGVFVTYGKDKYKEEVIEAFREKGTILISTTVVEVGISLPRLTTIVIVGAERLGLASLHQLRGRVSRNGLKGYCYLYTNKVKSERLEAFCETTNGFEIDELDLKYRQGGDLVGGVVQSGKKFVWFDMGNDEEILKEAKQRVDQISK